LRRFRAEPFNVLGYWQEGEGQGDTWCDFAIDADAMGRRVTPAS
jgi:hypothetical protein